MLTTTTHMVPTGDGWLLRLKQVRHAEAFDPAAVPVLIVPGYGMNSFIFGYHPRGTSLERAFAEAGHEVWSVDLRAQGGAQRTRREAPGPTLERYAAVDLPAAVRGALAASATDAEQLAVMGCSLGGTIAYAGLALTPDLPVAGVVAVGSPLQWDGLHPALRAAFRSERLAGAVRLRHTRRIARRLFPVLLRVPMLLSVYVNPANVDRSAVDELVRTVEDPVPAVNRDIARWMKARRLELGGVDVGAALSDRDEPLLLVIANRDGIVPEAAARSASDAWGGPVEVLEVGDDTTWYAHADLFIGQQAPRDVFAPILGWLAKVPTGA